jgi:hypothetical protein
MTQKVDVCRKVEPEYEVMRVEDAILTIRGQRVIMDYRLAEYYGVMTSALNQAVKRNADRFPEDFAFQLTEEEFTRLMSQSVTSKGRGGRRKLPFVFTEHGAMMAANVLRNPHAAQMSIFVVRAFMRMRQVLLSRHEMEKRLEQIEKILLVHDDAVRDLYEKIRPLLLPPPDPPRKRIGFGSFDVKPDARSMMKEHRARYEVKHGK